MTEADRAALWRTNRTAREQAVTDVKAARIPDAGAVAAFDAAWAPLETALREKHQVETLDETVDASLQSPNVWIPGIDYGKRG